MQTYPVIAGPTATGKTALAIAVAQALHGEVVSADSMQVYDDVWIGTARPTAEEQQGIPHHLQGFLPLGESYSVARYVEDAYRVFAQLYAQGKTPVLCGGTGLYVQSFMENIQFFPQPSDPQLRQELLQTGQEQGGAALLEELRRIDPDTAARLHEHDLHRIVRALEIYRITGETLTQQERRSHSIPPPYRGCLFVLQYRDRALLYRRIEQRVDRMLEAGLMDEAFRVLQQQPSATVLQAIGYKEFLPYFSGACTLAEAVDTLKQETRRYAKRQMSWFRRLAYAQPMWLEDYASFEELKQDVLDRYRNFAAGGGL